MGYFYYHMDNEENTQHKRHVQPTVYDKMFEGENFCGFHVFLLTMKSFTTEKFPTLQLRTILK